MSILGNRVVRKEDPHLLTGTAAYVDGLAVPAALRVTFVRSTMAHARLRSVDVSAAREAPGVVAVFTGEDVDFGPLTPGALFPQIDSRFSRWPLARDTVRFVGEPVAAIVAGGRYDGADAAELVEVDYDPLPVVVDVEESARETTLLFPEHGTNVVARLDLPPVDDLFAGADVVVSQRMVNQRVAPAPMEGRACAAEWDGERLTFTVSTQGVSVNKTALETTFGLGPAAVRVVAGDVGGGFGAKGVLSPEEFMVGWLAIRLNRPVRWAETRTENLLAMVHGRGQVQTVEIGATTEGRIVGLRMDILQDAGGYPDFGAGLPAMTMVMSSGVYRIPKVAYTSRSCVTNTTPVGAYRGAGRPEAAAALERTIDVLARKLDMDPAELRRRNFIPPEAFPATTAVGTTYDCGNYAAALERALAAADYPALRAEQARRRDAGAIRQLGIGIATYVEITGGLPGPEPARVAVREDGSAIVFTGSTPHGQGHVTMWAMIAGDRLGIDIADVEVVYGDTDRVPPGLVTGGSRSVQVCGVVVGRAADRVVEQGRRLAAEMLEASPEDVVLDTTTGHFHVAGAPSISHSWAEVAARATEPLSAEEIFEPSGPTFPFGANVAVVEVDTETGRVELQRLVGCDDAGRIINPLLAEGQIHGGMAQGVAQALMEEVAFDEGGNPLTTTFADYAAVSAAELPSFELIEMQTPTPNNELGAKGIGESGAIGSTPCVVNAVVDALAHLDVRHIDMPMTPVRVWQAMAGARVG
ncbi:MAG TPA: xanthine dehydrogenase family protein molybdopterin-binding subunit [Acidimicrobiales bacterium]